MATLHLTIKEVLVNARKAFDEDRLQIQQQTVALAEEDYEILNKGCTYTGPCAIGASMPYSLASEFDNMSIFGDDVETASMTIDDLIALGRVTSDEPHDLKVLQEAHDDGHMPYFVATLEELETKYELRPLD